MGFTSREYLMQKKRCHPVTGVQHSLRVNLGMSGPFLLKL